MTGKNPESRPDAAEAQRYWRMIRSSIFSLQRVSRLRKREEIWAESAILDIFSFVRLGMWLSSSMYEKVIRLMYSIRSVGG